MILEIALGVALGLILFTERAVIGVVASCILGIGLFGAFLFYAFKLLKPLFRFIGRKSIKWGSENKEEIEIKIKQVYNKATLLIKIIIIPLILVIIIIVLVFPSSIIDDAIGIPLGYLRMSIVVIIFTLPFLIFKQIKKNRSASIVLVSLMGMILSMPYIISDPQYILISMIGVGTLIVNLIVFTPLIILDKIGDNRKNAKQHIPGIHP